MSSDEMINIVNVEINASFDTDCAFINGATDLLDPSEGFGTFDLAPAASMPFNEEGRIALPAFKYYLINQFKDLAKRWRNDTAHLSSVEEKAKHPCYQRIVGMGPDAIPILLHQLRENPDHWFWALKSITGEDPVEPDDRGNIMAMAKAWLDWGERKGYLW